MKSPIKFDKTKNFDGWMSKGVLGEKLWTADKRYKDKYFLFTIIPAQFVIIAFYTAYMNLFWDWLFKERDVLKVRGDKHD